MGIDDAWVGMLDVDYVTAYKGLIICKAVDGEKKIDLCCHSWKV